MMALLPSFTIPLSHQTFPLRPFFSGIAGQGGQIFHHGEVLEDESRGDAATDEGVAAEGTCCLPGVGGDGDNGVAVVGLRVENVLMGGLDFRIEED